MDKIEGYLEVGTNERNEVVINLDKDRNGLGHIVFSVRQAYALADTLIRQARLASEAARESQLQRITGKCPVCRGVGQFKDFKYLGKEARTDSEWVICPQCWKENEP